MTSFEWFIIVLNIVVWVGLGLSYRYAKRIKYPYIKTDIIAPLTLIVVFTIASIGYFIWYIGTGGEA